MLVWAKGNNRVTQHKRIRAGAGALDQVGRCRMAVIEVGAGGGSQVAASRKAQQANPVRVVSAARDKARMTSRVMMVMPLARTKTNPVQVVTGKAATSTTTMLTMTPSLTSEVSIPPNARTTYFRRG